MSTVMVYVFLLDNISGFSKALNDSLRSNTPKSQNKPPGVRRCDYATTNLILNALSKESESEYSNMLKLFKTSLYEEEPQENMFNLLLEHERKQNDSVLRNKYYDDKFNDIDSQENTISVTDVNTDVTNRAKHVLNNSTNNNATFFVSIFETLANITAQTCAGALISPRWVLTASNCVNILKSVYNNTNMTNFQTLHTVIADTLNPLSDGTAHNVTNILTHNISSSYFTRNLTEHVDLGPNLALLRIEPEVQGVIVPFVHAAVSKGDVTVYGWILNKTGEGNDLLSPVNVSARILTSAECQAMYSYINKEIICLYTNNHQINITQLSCGGPVLIQQDGQNKILAVVHVEQDVLVAYTIYERLDSIKHIIDNKE